MQIAESLVLPNYDINATKAAKRAALPDAMWEELHKSYVVDGWLKAQYDERPTTGWFVDGRQSLREDREMGTRFSTRQLERTTEISYEGAFLQDYWLKFMRVFMLRQMPGPLTPYDQLSPQGANAVELKAPYNMPVWFSYFPLKALANTENYKRNVYWFALHDNLCSPNPTTIMHLFPHSPGEHKLLQFPSLSTYSPSLFPPYTFLSRKQKGYQQIQSGFSLSLTPSFKGVFLSMAFEERIPTPTNLVTLPPQWVEAGEEGYLRTNENFRYSLPFRLCRDLRSMYERRGGGELLTTMYSLKDRFIDKKIEEAMLRRGRRRWET